MVNLPVVETCCCGCSLDSGAKFIAWLQIVCGVMLAFLSIAAIAFANVGKPSDLMRVSGTISGLYWVAASVLLVACAIMLLIGIQENRPHYVQSWVIVNIITLIIYVIHEFFLAIYAICVYDELIFGLIMIVGSLIMFAITSYCIVVVSSLRKEMIREKK